MSKILIVSHNPLSNLQSNGKTISSILSCFKKEDLAQLYFTLDKPDFDICTNFFRITDVDILKNFFLLNNNVGNRITYDYVNKNNGEKEKYHHNFLYNFIRKLFVSKISIMTTIRDFVWRNSDYYSKAFEQWLDEFSPDVVFFQSSNCCFAFNFVYKICKKRNIRTMIETTDDYLSYKNFNPFYNYNVYKLRKCYSLLNNYCDIIFPISDLMGEYYSGMFPNNYYTVMNSVNISSIPYKFNKKRIKMLYAGNLGLGRWKVLYKLAKSIDSLNANIVMEIYSLEKPADKVIDALNEFKCCKYCYSLNGDQLINKRKEADVLLHVESFSKKNRHLTKYSISTKIPELMNSNRVILAIGPDEIASIKYLSETKTAYVVSSDKEEEIKKEINNFVKIKDYQKYVVNCKTVVKDNHDLVKVHNFIKKFVGEHYD